MRYTIVDTAWGEVFFAGEGRCVRRLTLPTRSKRRIPQDATHDSRLFPSLQRRIVAFFQGQEVHFDDVEVDLSGVSPFQQRVLCACRTIAYGESLSYASLAKLSGRPGAARAVGTAMARNPVPVIVPCHRVISSGGGPGGFSAPGGVWTKKRLLQLEGHTFAGRRDLLLA